MAGRTIALKQELEERKVIDAVLGLWEKEGQIQNFKAIHNALVEKGVVQKSNYRYKTLRILDRLEKMGFIEKVGRGKYKIKIEPTEYRLFDLLERIRQKSEMSRVIVGGSFWRAAEIYLLGFPEKAFSYDYVQYASRILSVRLTQLFQAYKSLWYVVKTKGEEGYLPENVVRELILELPAYYLGSRAGMDGDGLPTDELIEAEEKMLQALPESIKDEETGWADNTCKNLIIEEFDELKKIALLLLKQNAYDESEDFLKGAKEDKFALVITPPEWELDEEGWERREIVGILESEKDEDPLYIAVMLLHYDRERVLKTLQIEGVKFLGKEKAQAVEDVFNKLVACKDLALILYPVIGREDALSDPFAKRIIRIARRKAKDYASKYGEKEIISLFPLIPHFFRGKATVHDVKIIFPKVSAETIQAWLQEGEQKLDKIRDRLEEKIEKILKKNQCVF